MLKSPQLPVKKAYQTTLSNFQVFDQIAKADATKPYVIIQDVSKIQDTDKDTEGYTVEVQLYIVTDYQGTLQSETIAEQIVQAIMPSIHVTGFFLEDFEVWKTENTVDRVLPTIQTQTQSINNKVLSFKHYLKRK